MASNVNSPALQPQYPMIYSLQEGFKNVVKNSWCTALDPGDFWRERSHIPRPKARHFWVDDFPAFQKGGDMWSFPAGYLKKSKEFLKQLMPIRSIRIELVALTQFQYVTLSPWLIWWVVLVISVLFTWDLLRVTIGSGFIITGPCDFEDSGVPNNSSFSMENLHHPWRPKSLSQYHRVD